MCRFKINEGSIVVQRKREYFGDEYFGGEEESAQTSYDERFGQDIICPDGHRQVTKKEKVPGLFRGPLA